MNQKVQKALASRYVKPLTGKYKGRTLYVKSSSFNPNMLICDVNCFFDSKRPTITINVNNVEVL